MLKGPLIRRPELTLAPFRPADLVEIKFRDRERALLAGAGDLNRYAEALAGCTYAATGRIDGVAVGCAGILPRHDGVGEAWALLSTRLPEAAAGRAWALVTRTVADQLARALAGEFHRVEIHVRADFPPASRWAMRLGFVCEGVEIAYGPDRADYWRFARVAARVFDGRV